MDTVKIYRIKSEISAITTLYCSFSFLSRWKISKKDFLLAKRGPPDRAWVMAWALPTWVTLATSAASPKMPARVARARFFLPVIL